ncbi:MAG: TatD family hydrolase [Candidatus Sericytochromatia bacterium]|nr:TatD family hydrolase [Candidatus Sericytochromatia bacterium]
MELIDTHAHLNLGQYAEDQGSIIDNALKAGISRIVTPGVTLESCLSAFDLSDRYPGLFYCALGIHPTDAAGWGPDVQARFLELSTRPEVVAIGETGLDYYWDSCPKEIQHAALRGQIALAKNLKLPLILHVRDKKDSQAAYDDLLRILREEQAEEVGGVMHCFSGDLPFAYASLELNFYLALGGVLTFKNAPVLQAVAREIPLQHLVLETDSPWLSPLPYRGKRNQPAYVRLVAEKLAELKGLSLEAIATETTRNACQLFHFPALS